MAVQGIHGASAIMQQPVPWIKENTASEEAKESQAQKAAEAQKAAAAKVLTPSPKGVGETVNRKV